LIAVVYALSQTDCKKILAGIDLASGIYFGGFGAENLLRQLARLSFGESGAVQNVTFSEYRQRDYQHWRTEVKHLAHLGRKCRY
jgi:hypothetical protein